MSSKISLAEANPALAAQWHPTKNAPLTPADVSPYSTRKVWWLCEQGHEWEAFIGNRSRGAGCPYCKGLLPIAGENDLATLHPVLLAEWAYDLNGAIRPEFVSPGSSKKVWWRCKTCHLAWEANPDNRTRKKQGCPFCSGHRLVPGKNDLLSMAPQIATQYHPTLNTIPVEKVFRKSPGKCWWLCEQGHEWEASPNSRAAGNGCPTCKNKRVLAGYNDLATTHPHLAAQYHPTKNTLPVTEITYGMGKKVWWLCEEGHEWKESPNGRSHYKMNCPYCSNHRIILGQNDLATTHPGLAKQWHSTRNDRTPQEVVAGAEYMAWWQCEKGHEWKCYVYSRTGPDPSGCGRCANVRTSRMEQALIEFLEENGVRVVPSARKILPGKQEIDIYCPDQKLGIEFNGLYWHSEEQGKNKWYHHAKWLAAQQAGIQLLQIWEDQWREAPETVKKALLHKLGISKGPRVFARQTMVQDVSKKEAEKFLKENHIQGFASGRYYLGLCTKENALVAVMVLKNETGRLAPALNIIRYATAATVVGGFTKLMQYAVRTYNVQRFVTFSDNCISNGGLYSQHGFRLDGELNPDYMYVVARKRQHKFGYRLKRFQNDPNLHYEPNKTEAQLARMNALSRVWDAGKIRWVWERVEN